MRLFSAACIFTAASMAFSWGGDLRTPKPTLDGKLLKNLNASMGQVDEDRPERFAEGQEAVNPTLPEEVHLLRLQSLKLEKFATQRGRPKALRSRDMPWVTGAKPINLVMAVGFQTKIFFFDSAGNPIKLRTPNPPPVGDSSAIGVASQDNMVLLWVKAPWQTTNLSVFLDGQNLPVEFTISSEFEPKKAVDTQLRVNLQAASAISMDRAEIQGKAVLSALTAGISNIDNVANIPIASIEQSTLTSGGRTVNGTGVRWVPVSIPDLLSAKLSDGKTYLVLKPGFALLQSGYRILSQLRGADQSTGYIVAGNNPRTFLLSGPSGIMYRVILDR